MAHTSERFMVGDDQLLQNRLAAFLRERFPRDTACELARRIDCDERTARNIVAAHWPRAKHFRSIVREFGRDVLDALFEPDINETVARLKREVVNLEAQAEERRAALRKAEGALAGASAGVASHEDQAARLAQPRSFRGRGR